MTTSFNGAASPSTECGNWRSVAPRRTLRAMRASFLAVLLPVVGVVTASAAHAEDVAFVESSSELDDGKPASSMYNAIDGKDTTAWCAKPGDAMPLLSFGFAEPVTVTSITLLVGATKGTPIDLDKSKKRARIVYIGDNDHRVEAKFKDDVGVQTLELSPPAKGKRIVVEFPGVYDGAAPDAPLCVSEIVLKSKNNELTGASVATKLRSMNGPGKKLLHEWLDDVSAPTRTLLFNVDGTFAYRFEPLLEGKPAKVRGKWTAAGSSVTFTIGDKSWRMESRITRVDEGASPDAATVELTLQGDAPSPSMAATFHPAPSKLP